MDRYVMLLAILSLSTIVTTENHQNRHYDPNEENPERIRFIFIEDGTGGLKRVDLFETDPRRGIVVVNDLTFHLFTKQSETKPDIIPAENIEGLSQSKFDPSRPNVFLSHGWYNHANSPVNTIIRSAILERYDVNLFVVDWSRPANFNYFDAKNAVPIIGGFVGDFINEMIIMFNITTADFHLVGHSLGAHLVGCAGARVNGLVKSIVGLDPAGPLFDISNTDNRIDATDGEFVHIIHTNGGWLGLSSSLGHADYYPNGGKRQPGCGIDITGSCAHSRAYAFYAESVLTLNNSFVSRLCGSMDDFNNHLCNENHRSVMGHLHVDKTADGDYFLRTQAKSPFALG